MKVARNIRHDSARRLFFTDVAPLLVSICVVIAFTVVFYSFVDITSNHSSLQENSNFYCGSDGRVHLTSKGESVHTTQLNDTSWVESSGGISGSDPLPPPNAWDPALFLTITLGFGSLSFASAKAIDICWDLFVGRLGQVLLSSCVYKIIRMSMYRSTERRYVSFPVFARLSLDGISIESAYVLLRRGLNRRKLRTAVTILILLYVLFFPTFLSAITGYQAVSEPYLQVANAQLVPTANLTIPPLLVIDGERIGLHPYFPITDSSQTLYQAIKSYELDLKRWFDTCEQLLEFGSGISAANAATLQNVTIETPPYDSFQWAGHNGSDGNCYTNLLSNITLDGKTYSLSGFPLALERDGQSFWFAFQNDTYNASYIQQNGFCQASLAYQWGFSALLLFTFCIVTIIVLAFLAALQLDTYWNSQTYRLGLRFSIYQDILDLAKELRAQLGSKAEELQSGELTRVVEGGFVTVELDTDGMPAALGSLRSRKKGSTGYANLRSRLPEIKLRKRAWWRRWRRGVEQIRPHDVELVNGGQNDVPQCGSQYHDNSS